MMPLDIFLPILHYKETRDKLTMREEEAEEEPEEEEEEAEEE